MAKTKTFYLREGLVWIDLDDGYLLCICSQEQFEKATIEEIADMILKAMAINRYKCIEIWNKPTH